MIALFIKQSININSIRSAQAYDTACSMRTPPSIFPWSFPPSIGLWCAYRILVSCTHILPSFPPRNVPRMTQFHPIAWRYGLYLQWYFPASSLGKWCVRRWSESPDHAFFPDEILHHRWYLIGTRKCPCPAWVPPASLLGNAFPSAPHQPSYPAPEQWSFSFPQWKCHAKGQLTQEKNTHSVYL